MTLQECMTKRQIVNSYESLDIKYQGMNYSIAIGDKVGRLEIVYLVQYLEGKTKRKGCICKCDCGNYIGPSRLHMLLSGELVSCGCYSKDVHKELMMQNNTVHGYATRANREKLYILWGAMIDRAENGNRVDAKYYHDKGIKVCTEWRDYTTFRNWAMNNGYEDGLSIDRKDNSLGYNPDNCRWIKISEQNKNKTNNRYLEYKGKKLTITDWCRVTGLSWTTIDSGLKSGKSIGEVLGFE